MKKTFRMIGMACLVGAFAFAGSSCKKNKTEVNSFRVIMPTVEETTIGDSRSYIDFNDNNQIKWFRDDQIAFYNLAENPEHSIRNIYTISNGVYTADGYFTGDVMGELNEGFDGYYGFYPASKVINHPIGPRNSQTFDVPDKQVIQSIPNCETLMDPTACVTAIKGTDIVQHSTLKHVFGFVGLRLKSAENKVVDKIVIEDMEFPLSGTATLDLPYFTPETATVLDDRCGELANKAYAYPDVLGNIHQLCQTMNYSGQSTGKTMTLECGGVQLNPDTAKRFIIALRPGALHHGFIVTVYYTEGEPDVFNKFNPQSDEWFTTPVDLENPEATPNGLNKSVYPRGFCVRPGKVLNFNLN